MNDAIYVIVGKDGRSPAKSSGWKDARKLLVYTTASRARSAMASRGLSTDEYEVIEYVPKEAAN